MSVSKLELNSDQYVTFFEEKKKDTPMPLLGGAASSCLNFTMDLTGQVQGGFETTSALQEKFGYVSLKIFGITSCFNALTGPIAAASGYEESQLSQKVKDLNGEVMGWLKVVQGGLQTMAGLLFLPATIIAIALYFTVSKALKVASKILGRGSSLVLTIGSILLLIGSAISLKERMEMNGKMNHLLAQQNIPTDERYQKVLEMLQEMGTTQKGEIVLTRIFGKKGMRILASVERDKTREVVEKCLTINHKQTALAIFYMAIEVIGSVLTILSFIFTIGAPALVIAVIGSLLSLIWLISDLDLMARAFKENEKGKFDKAWMVFSTFLCSGLVALALIFCSTGWSMLISLIMGCILLIAHLVCFARMNMASAAALESGR